MSITLDKEFFWKKAEMLPSISKIGLANDVLSIFQFVNFIRMIN